MNLQLQDKIILVSGGAKGIGLGICQTLATEGAIPIIVGRNAADNQHAVVAIEQAGGRAFAVTAELSDPDASQRAVTAVLDQFGRLDGLVNNAGANDGVGLENGNYPKFMASMHQNLVHYYLLGHYALPALKAVQGAIVNISSKTAETGQGGTSAYAAANGGRNALTREWAVELLPYNIRVNAIVVAECWTPLYERWIQTLPDPIAKRQEIESRIPLGRRMTTVEEIGAMAAFLLSPVSGHTTGQLIHVDGGYVHLDRAI